jgi:hypothetical protein
MPGPYMNDPGYEVPEKNVLVVPFDINSDGNYLDIIQSLAGNPKRDWFDAHYYYCLPLNIGNQQGFIIKSLRDFDIIWDGTTADAQLTFPNMDNSEKQVVQVGFGNGVITIQNMFSLKTPPGVNLMAIQPPNMFIKGCAALTCVIECDQLRRDFTFNFKVTVPNVKIEVRKGDPVGAFIPVPRYFTDGWELKMAKDIFDLSIIKNELDDSDELNRQRLNEDKERPHESGRMYFNGIHAYGEQYVDHQKRVK